MRVSELFPRSIPTLHADAHATHLYSWVRCVLNASSHVDHIYVRRGHGGRRVRVRALIPRSEG
jgi:hypothetical protein